MRDDEPTNPVEPASDRQTVADSVFARLSDAILQGDLSPGAKISEPELSRRFGISRAPLREAIRRLEARNLVTRAPRLGARVIVLSPESIRQIFLVREALEGMAAREAAKHITDDEITYLWMSLDRQERRSEEIGFDTYLTQELDTDFHSYIARCSHNEFLVKLLCEEQSALLDLCRRQQRRVAERAHRAFIEHRRIVDALADRDADLAEIVMRRHIVAARENLEARARATAALSAAAPPKKSRRRSQATDAQASSA